MVGATVPARAGPRPPADLFAAAGARLPDFELSEAALPLATTCFSWIFIRPAENSLQSKRGTHETKLALLLFKSLRLCAP